MTQKSLVGSRAVVTARYAILPPAGIPAGVLPEWPEVDARVLTAPAMGARFAMYRLDVPRDHGSRQRLRQDIEAFAFVLGGRVALALNGADHVLGPGGFAYLKPGSAFELKALADEAALLWLRKGYVPVEQGRPDDVVGDEEAIAAEPYVFGSGNPRLDQPYPVIEGLRLKTLLPDTVAFDMAMNIFTFEPGHSLPVVETHVMEHGLYFLQGQGLYLLGDTWREVRTGDFIWMGPYCPQSFYATGSEPSRYLYYKDVHRDVSL